MHYTIDELLGKLYLAIDNLLYKIGVVTPFRRKIWTRNCRTIQNNLNREHDIANHYNKLNGTVYTLKRLLSVIEMKNDK